MVIRSDFALAIFGNVVMTVASPFTYANCAKDLLNSSPLLIKFLLTRLKKLSSLTDAFSDKSIREVSSY